MRNSLLYRFLKYCHWWLINLFRSTKFLSFAVLLCLSLGLLFIVYLWGEDVDVTNNPKEYPLTLSCDVERILDGDTIWVICPERKVIRLWGIDAPESDQVPWGEEAIIELSKMIEGREIKVKITEQDRYGRDIGQLFIGDLDINLELVKRGAVVVYYRYNQNNIYKNAEKEARIKHLGIWREDGMQQNPEKWRQLNP